MQGLVGSTHTVETCAKGRVEQREAQRLHEQGRRHITACHAVENDALVEVGLTEGLWQSLERALDEPARRAVRGEQQPQLVGEGKEK